MIMRLSLAAVALALSTCSSDASLTNRWRHNSRSAASRDEIGMVWVQDINHVTLDDARRHIRLLASRQTSRRVKKSSKNSSVSSNSVVFTDADIAEVVAADEVGEDGILKKVLCKVLDKKKSSESQDSEDEETPDVSGKSGKGGSSSKGKGKGKGGKGKGGKGKRRLQTNNATTVNALPIFKDEPDTATGTVETPAGGSSKGKSVRKQSVESDERTTTGDVLVTEDKLLDLLCKDKKFKEDVVEEAAAGPTLEPTMAIVSPNTGTCGGVGQPACSCGGVGEPVCPCGGVAEPACSCGGVGEPACSSTAPGPTTFAPAAADSLPVTPPVTQPTAYPVFVPMATPVATPVIAPVSPNVGPPVAQPTPYPVVVAQSLPIAQPVVSSSAQPTAAPVNVPTEMPAIAPVAAGNLTAAVPQPTAYPVWVPKAAPVDTPVSPSVSSPIPQPTEYPVYTSKGVPGESPLVVPLAVDNLTAPVTQPTVYPVLISKASPLASPIVDTVEPTAGPSVEVEEQATEAAPVTPPTPYPVWVPKASPLASSIVDAVEPTPGPSVDLEEQATEIAPVAQPTPFPVWIPNASPVASPIVDAVEPTPGPSVDLEEQATGIAPITQPTPYPVWVPKASPVASPMVPPVEANNLTAPVPQPTAYPVWIPKTAPATTPAVSPIIPPITMPVSSPVVAPVIPAMDSTLVSPIIPPITMPVASLAPVAVPTLPPVAPNTIPGVSTGQPNDPIVAQSGLVATECEDAFVYCPGISTCMVGSAFNNNVPIAGSWGFNIEYDAIKDHDIDNCEIWKGVSGCELNTGVKVGTATITQDLFHFCLDLNDYESNSFQLYAGKCVASDAGFADRRGGMCLDDEISMYATDFDKYTMVANGGPLVSAHTFDRSDAINSEFWMNGTPFPLGLSGSEYLIGHVSACSIGRTPAPSEMLQEQAEDPIVFAPTHSPTVSPTDLATNTPTGLPTGAPFVAPTDAPTGQPSDSPTAGPTPRPTGVPTSAPTDIPTDAPTDAPIVAPTPFPSEGPTPVPTNGPTASPSYGPTEPPTSAPTHSPTISPTAEPSASPTSLIIEQVGSTCETGFVYCPGRSTCFTDLVEATNEVGMWGWSIEYTGGVIDDCEIYIGGDSNCDLTGATKVGTFTIAPNLVHYCLDIGVYESNSYHFYAGKCEVNDAGSHFHSNDECSAEDEAKYANEWSTYPLKSEGGPMVDVFSFDEMNESMGSYWTSQYQIFQSGIGGPFRQYLSAHVDVCATPIPPSNSPTVGPSATPSTSTPTELPTIEPTSGPSGKPTLVPTFGPTQFPTVMPSPRPTGEPSSAPLASAPTGSPTFIATSSPISTLTPTHFPTSVATSSPISTLTSTDLPMSGVTSSPVVSRPSLVWTPTTIAPTAVATDNLQEQAEGCQDAWVYCPGRSKCLNDATFNDGLPAVGADGSVSTTWGWSIEFDPATVDYLVDDCQILIGGVDCDLNTAVQVGTFEIREDYAHFCLDDFGYVSNEFGLYAGSCTGNDAGNELETGECNPSDVALNAATPATFPYYYQGDESVINHTVENSDSVNSGFWPAAHQMFPMVEKSFLTGYSCVSPAAPTGNLYQQANTAQGDASSDPPTKPGIISWPFRRRGNKL